MFPTEISTSPYFFPNEIDGKFDTAFIAVRTNYTGNAVNSIVPYLAENGLLVSLQNGINFSFLEQAVGPDRAIGAALPTAQRQDSARPHSDLVARPPAYRAHPWKDNAST